MKDIGQFALCRELFHFSLNCFIGSNGSSADSRASGMDLAIFVLDPSPLLLLHCGRDCSGALLA